MPDPVAVAVLAKAPVPGYAKTRLIPHLGAEGAASLQEALTVHALATALASSIGPVTLWGAPDVGHPCFQSAVRRLPIRVADQPEGDLGVRMLAAFQASGGPLVLLGTDCPVLTATDLREAANALRHGADVALAPAEDGGYGLIGARRPFPYLFEAMPWSTARVAALTAERARAAGLRFTTLRQVWDVDTLPDVERLRRSGLLDGLGDAGPPLRIVAAKQQTRLM